MFAHLANGRMTLYCILCIHYFKKNCINCELYTKFEQCTQLRKQMIYNQVKLYSTFDGRGNNNCLLAGFPREGVKRGQHPVVLSPALESTPHRYLSVTRVYPSQVPVTRVYPSQIPVAQIQQLLYLTLLRCQLLDFPLSGAIQLLEFIRLRRQLFK